MKVSVESVKAEVKRLKELAMKDPEAAYMERASLYVSVLKHVAKRKGDANAPTALQSSQLARAVLAASRLKFRW